METGLRLGRRVKQMPDEDQAHDPVSETEIEAEGDLFEYPLNVELRE